MVHFVHLTAGANTETVLGLQGLMIDAMCEVQGRRRSSLRPQGGGVHGIVDCQSVQRTQRQYLAFTSLMTARTDSVPCPMLRLRYGALAITVKARWGVGLTTQ